MAKYDKVDLKMTPGGDLVIENGSLALVRKQEFIMIPSGRITSELRLELTSMIFAGRQIALLLPKKALQ
jgi:hypothetical protein